MVRIMSNNLDFKLQEQKKNDWRKKREEFINNLRAAKEVQRHLANGGSIKDLPPPPPSDTSDYIQCPHCGRRSKLLVKLPILEICNFNF